MENLLEIIIYDLETIHDSERGNYAEKGTTDGEVLGLPAFHGSNGHTDGGHGWDEKPTFEKMKYFSYWRMKSWRLPAKTAWCKLSCWFFWIWNQNCICESLEPFEVLEVCMNAHKKSKSSGNPGPRSSNLQLWMSKARVRTAETLTPLSKNTFFYLYFEFLSNYFLAVCPFHIPLYPATPAVYPLDCLQENLSSLWQLRILPRYSPATAFVPSPKMVFVHGLMGWIERRFSKVSAVDLNLAGRMSSLQLSFYNFHLSLDVIQCHPVILSSHSITRSAAARLFAEDHGASDRIKPTAGFLPAISPP